MVFYIYKIVGVNYIGSTNDIKLRCSQHKHCCFKQNSNGYNYLIYQYIREKEIDIKLEILFSYKGNCSNKIKRLVEQFYINKYDSVNNGLNKCYAFGEDKKKVKQHNKTYNEKNKDKKKKYIKEWREENKEKYKKRSKEYYHKHKEATKIKRRDYFINYKKKYNKIKINCPICNCLITQNHMARHQRTKKCKNAKLLLNT